MTWSCSRASVGKYLDRAFGTRRWINSDKAVVKRRPFGVVGNEILLLKRASQSCRGLAGFVIIDLGK